jgi:hypothetical protein
VGTPGWWQRPGAALDEIWGLAEPRRCHKVCRGDSCPGVMLLFEWGAKAKLASGTPRSLTMDKSGLLRLAADRLIEGGGGQLAWLLM